jgi:hypothetical protein
VKTIRAQDFPRNDEAGYPCVGWDLDDDHKVSFGRDGDLDTWIVYLALPGGHDDNDVSCEVDRDEIRNLGRMLVQMVDEADAEDAAELAEARANVDARRRSLWSQP